ncbi:uncharacterized protein LOC115774812 isoform X2 [Archocentrus centrarchus]|uniref:uncharacterized protein LOC115774812 isoform X2 n=1 Tax=Archocentrus centrarchus TaxID=63155 RepID=UPI0011EA4BE7|nr:uncharacterized protein LOC115774812 isoform X2 [Archocentrus centrarchus]
MVEKVYTVMRLLLLSLIRTGVTGDEGVIFAERCYNISVPCAKDLICFHVWHFNTKQASDYIAIVTNRAIQTSRSQDDDSKCTLQIKDLTAGHHRCQQRPGVSSPHNITPEFILMPGETVSLQCFLFSHLEQRHCCAQQQKQISLMWVDETGAQIQEDFQNRIKQQTVCDITLTFTLQSPESKTFRCRVTVDDQVQSSVKLQVRVLALKGRGRGFIGDPEPQPQGHKQGAIGAAVGVVGCAILTVLVAAFVVSRRKARIQLPNESPNTISSTTTLFSLLARMHCGFKSVSPQNMPVSNTNSVPYKM